MFYPDKMSHWKTSKGDKKIKDNEELTTAWNIFNQALLDIQNGVSKSNISLEQEKYNEKEGKS